MTHLLPPTALRTLVALLVCSSFSAVHGWDEVAGGGLNALGPLPSASSDEGRNIYNVARLSTLWEAQAVLNTSRDKVAHISLDEEVIFVQSSAGVVTALNTDSGRRYWSAQVGRNDEVSMKASTDSEIVAIVSGPVLHAFDKFTGNRHFSYRLSQQAMGAPLIVRREVAIGNRLEVSRSIFIPLADRSVVAYDVETLRYLGAHGTLKPKTVHAKDWRFVSGEMVRFAPVAGAERLAFGTDVGNLHVVDMTGAAKGKTRFQFLMGSRMTAPMTVVTREDDEFLVAACENNRIFCIALHTNGGMVWTIPMARPVYEPITVVGNDVFIITSDGDLHKFDLRTGLPVLVSDGCRAVASRSVGSAGELPAYGAAVDVNCRGLLGMNPIQIRNTSTGQLVNSLTIDFSRLTSGLTFASDEQGEPVIRYTERDRTRTGLKSASLSPDRRSLTLEFADFQPEEKFDFFADLEHPEIPSWKLTHKALNGGDVQAQVSPIRTSLLASSDASRRVEPLPPRTVVGRFTEMSHAWRTSEVKSLVAVSEASTYFVDYHDRVVSVDREDGENRTVTPTRDYSIHINNQLTDRVFVSTQSGRIACFTETRVELGSLMLPTPICATWLAYPKALLTPEFAVYHQNPGARPLMPDVPKTDPPAANQDDADGLQ